MTDKKSNPFKYHAQRHSLEQPKAKQRYQKARAQRYISFTLGTTGKIDKQMKNVFSGLKYS